MTVDLPPPALVLLDQAPLSEMAKSAAYAKDLRAFLSSENGALALDFSHAQETALWTPEDRERLLQEIEVTPYKTLRGLSAIIDEEVRDSLHTWLGVSTRQPRTAAGPIFPDNPAFTFSEAVRHCVLHSHGGETFRKKRTEYEQVIVPQTRARQQALLAENPNLSPAELEMALIRPSLFDAVMKTRAYVTPSGIHAGSESSIRRFVTEVDLRFFPYLCMFTAFSGYRYSDENRANTKGDLCDAEHAVHAMWTCSLLVTERNVAGVIEQMLRKRFEAGQRDEHVPVLRFAEFKARLGRGDLKGALRRP